MHFVGYSQEAESEEERDTSVWNWYIEALYDDVTADLMEKYDCDQTKAEQMLYHSGLKIYCAMDPEAQKIAEEEYQNEDNYGTDGAVESGFYMLDYSGRVLATVGSRQEKPATCGLTMRQTPNGSPVPVSSPSVFMQQPWIWV